MSKITLESLSIRNFNSFGDVPQVFLFPARGMYRVIGKNMDVNPETIGTSNLQVGVGKSSFFSALSFAITGDTPKKISKDSLINKKNKKNLHLSLIFKKDKERYKIDRYRKHSKFSNQLLLFKEQDGEWINITLEDLKFTQEFINKLFGVNFDVLLKTTIIARDGSRNFLDLPTHERNQVIENIIQLDKLKDYAQKIKDKLRETRKQFDYVNLDLSETTGSVRTLRSLILQDISSKKQKRIDIKDRISDLKKILNENSVQFSVTKKFLADVEIVKEKDRAYAKKAAEQKSFYDKKDPYSLPNLYQKYSSWKNTYLDEATELNALINSVGDVCDNCGKEINPQKRIKKIQDKTAANKKDRKLLSERIKSFRDRVKAYRKIMKEVLEKEMESSKAYKDFNKQHADEISYSQWVEEYEQKYSEYAHIHDEVEEKQKELESISIENIISLRKKLIEKRKKFNEFKLQLDGIKHQIEVGEYWDTAFDFRNEGSIKSYIINKIVPVFNNILSSFVTIMFNGQMMISFNGAFEETIVYGGEEYDYEQLSTGEKAKLNLCIAFSIFNMTRMNLVSINCMFIDEMFAGMDGDTIKKFLDIIRNGYSKSLSIFIVSYESGIDEHLNPDGVITIKKENKESFIE